eukprot:gene28729-35642_t
MVLSPGLSFLNVGSGSGYLSCLVSHLIGPTGLCHGIDISAAVVEHSRLCCEKWTSRLIDRLKSSAVANALNGPNETLNEQNASMIRDSISFVQGNCFHIDAAQSILYAKYDRIYVGAGCPDSHKEFFYNMLTVGGILILPVTETSRLTKVKRLSEHVFSCNVVSNVTFAPLLSVENVTDRIKASSRFEDPAVRSSEAAKEMSELLAESSRVIGQVRSPSLVVHKTLLPSSASSSPNRTAAQGLLDLMAVDSPPSSPSLLPSVRLPSLLWSPNRLRHKQYPASFQRAVLTILLCVRFGRGVGSPAVAEHHATSSSSSSAIVTIATIATTKHVKGRCYDCLPSHLWVHIVSFCNRDWFDRPASALQLLATELVVEKQLRQHAEEQLKAAERACRAAERERDLFRSVMMRMSKRNQMVASAAGHHIFADEEEEGEEEASDVEEEEDDDEEDEEVDVEEVQEEMDFSDNEQEEQEEEDDDEEDGLSLLQTLPSSLSATTAEPKNRTNGNKSSSNGSNSMLFVPETTATLMTPISLLRDNISDEEEKADVTTTASEMSSSVQHSSSSSHADHSSVVSPSIPIAVPSAVDSRVRGHPLFASPYFHARGDSSAHSSSCDQSGFASRMLSSSLGSETTHERDSLLSAASRSRSGSGVHLPFGHAANRLRRYSTCSELSCDVEEEEGEDDSSEEVRNTQHSSGGGDESSHDSSSNSSSFFSREIRRPLGRVSVSSVQKEQQRQRQRERAVSAASGKHNTSQKSDESSIEEEDEEEEGSDSGEEDEEEDTHFWY